MRRKPKRRRRNQSGWLTAIIIEGLALLAFVGLHQSNREIADSPSQEVAAYEMVAPSLLEQAHPIAQQPTSERFAWNHSELVHNSTYTGSHSNLSWSEPTRPGW